MGVGNIDAREERVAVVDARHNETEDKFDSSFSRKMFPGQADAAKVIIARFGSLTNKVLHGKGGIEVDTQILDCVRNRNGCVD